MAIALLACAAILARPAASDAPASSSRPNIVFLLTDDQRAGELSVMDNVREMIGDRGVQFKRAYVSDPLCCPSRATFMTGQYMHNHGVESNDPPNGGYTAFEPKQQHSLAPWLDDTYETIHIGKYLNGYGAGTSDPTFVPPGWDDWHGYVGPGHRYWGYKLNNNGVVEQYGEDPETVPPSQQDPADYQTTVYKHLAADAIEEHAAADPDEPFYLSVAFTAPHVPADAAPSDAGKYQSLPLPTGGAYNESGMGDKPQFLRDRTAPITNSQKNSITQVYRAQRRSLLAVDRAVKKIIKTLQETDLIHNTYIVFASDNGFFRGEHRIRHGKVLAYEPASKVPLLIRGPTIPHGEKSNELVANIDYAPTVLDLSGASADIVRDGRSLLPFALQPVRQTFRPLLIEGASSEDLEEEPEAGTPVSLASTGAVVHSPAYEAIRTRRWLWVEYADGARELYDMKNDPNQLHSLHDKVAYAGVRAELEQQLDKLRNCKDNKQQALESCGRERDPVPAPG